MFLIVFACLSVCIICCILFVSSQCYCSCVCVYLSVLFFHACYSFARCVYVCLSLFVFVCVFPLSFLSPVLRDFCIVLCVLCFVYLSCRI